MTEKTHSYRASAGPGNRFSPLEPWGGRQPSGIISLREWQTVGPKDDVRLASPCSFTPEEAAFASELGRSNRIEILEIRDGLRIATTSFVGAVNVGRLTLNIRPKLAELSPAAMAALLRYALGIEMASRFNGAAEVFLEAGGIADLLALALLEQVNTLLRAGLAQDYETQAQWRTSPRGRLDLTEFARAAGRRQTTSAVPCRFSERITDTSLNRLVSATLDAFRILVTDRELAFDLHGRATLLAGLCQSVPLTHALLSEADAAIDRRSAHYQPILEIAELILQGLGASVHVSDRSMRLSSFLVDMNVLFERFLCRLLRDYGPARLRVETQVSHGSAYKWSDNPHGWQRPRLRPDIILYEAGTKRPALILDAKYKTLGAAARPTSQDLYQLTLYSISFGHQTHVPARIVFPDTSSRAMTRPPRLEFHGDSRNPALASVSFFGLPILSVTEALHRKDDTYLHQFAETLTG